MPVGFHVLECLADLVKGKYLVDRQLQFSRFHRAPKILAHLVENLADFLDGAGTEGDADVIDAARRVPLIAAVLIGHFVFRFHPALLFGICAGVRTTTAALGMIQEAAKSKIPALGYGMPYAIGNTLLTIFGMAIVLLMAG